MNEVLAYKSKKTMARIDSLILLLKSHRESIRLLRYFAKNQLFEKNDPFSPRIVKYTSIPRSEERYRLTVKNLNDQISVLENELATLIEYGA